MIGLPFELSYNENNPLDLVEEFCESKGWTFVRGDETAITITLPGQKLNYNVQLEWQDEYSALMVSCAVPVEIQEEHDAMAMDAFGTINENLWLGHFDLSAKGGKYPTFRHTMLLRMIPAGVAIDLIGDVLEIAQAECNRFYSTFQLASKGDTRLQDDLDAAVFETVGEA